MSGSSRVALVYLRLKVQVQHGTALCLAQQLFRSKKLKAAGWKATGSTCRKCPDVSSRNRQQLMLFLVGLQLKLFSKLHIEYRTRIWSILSEVSSGRLMSCHLSASSVHTILHICRSVLASHGVLASVVDPTSQDHLELQEKRPLTYGLPELGRRQGTRMHPKMRSPACPQGPQGPQHSDVEPSGQLEQQERMGDAHDAEMTPELQRQPSPKVHAAHLRSFELTAADQIDQVDQAAHIWVHSIHQAGLIPKESLPPNHQG
mmetsp:Transcript_63309/g.100555  ORF Transcript_63309/g.100555 Transcript_63309/m.100555 type:complete len:260 (-) Transcript_63309:194-973(-)